MTITDRIDQIYAGFNARDFEAVFQALSEDIVWANAWEGGYVHGHEGIRNYWTRQWKELNPRVTPVQISQTADDQVAVAVEQSVKDLSGNIVFTGRVMHYFTFSNGLIARFDLEPFTRPG